jgi:Ser/Thr protein kinase RdoA (MazF antagonist)
LEAEEQPERIVAQFGIDGQLQEMEPLGRGHIHQTWCGRFRTPRGIERYVHQRINRSVFEHPERVMRNIERVTEHLRRKLQQTGLDPARHTLTIVPATDGRSFYRTPRGEYWRTFRYIEGATTYDVVRDDSHVYHTARAFASFVQMVGDLGQPPLFETIPNFGNTRMRFDRFSGAAEDDPLNRAATAGDVIAFAQRRETLSRLLVDLLAAGDLPVRIIHFDTKINNVLIDDRTGEGICVIDLDTVMPGTVLYDFGDSVRFATCRAAEDEPDPRRVRFEPDLFDALVRGYLEVVAPLLVPQELDHLVDSAIALTYVAGLRFLTDHLEGDPYFAAARPGQNLDRCRVQFALVEAMEAHADRMRAAVERYR